MASQGHGRKRCTYWVQGCAAFLMCITILNQQAEFAHPKEENRVQRYSVITLEKGQRLETLAKIYHTTSEKIRLDNAAVKTFEPGVTLTIREGDAPPREASRGAGSSWFWPVLGPISQNYGWQNVDDFHHGIDVAVPSGTVIRAARGGKVIKAGWVGVYGLTLMLDHGNGVQTLYAHNQTLLVKQGQQIERGAEIAEAGSSGKSSGPHLHFEIRIHGKTVDPFRYLPNINLAKD